MKQLFFFLLILLKLPLLAMDNQDSALDQFLQHEAKNYLKICKNLRGVLPEEKLTIKIDGFTNLIENRLKNNISLDIEVRILYRGSPKVPLYITCHQDQLISLTKRLLKLGADPNRVSSGSTLPPLIAAVSAGATKTVKILLKAGANPNAKGVLETACKVAAEKSAKDELIKKYIRNIKWLLKYGANPNVTWRAFIYPTDTPKASSLLYVMNRMERGAIQVMKRLLKAGADPNYTENTTKESLLHFATWFTVRSTSIDKGKRYAKAAKLLLQYGANPNAQDKLGKTPLFDIKLAIVNIALDIFKILLLFEADITIKGYNGQDVFAYAQTSRNLCGAQFLKEWQEGKIRLKKKKLR